MDRKLNDPNPGAVASKPEPESFEDYFYSWYLKNVPPYMLFFGILLCVLAAFFVIFGGKEATGIGGRYLYILIALFGILLILFYLYMRVLDREFDNGGKRTAMDFAPSGLILLFVILAGAVPDITAGSTLFVIGLISLFMVPRIKPNVMLALGLSGAVAFVILRSISGSAPDRSAYIAFECIGAAVLSFISYTIIYRERTESFQAGFRLSLANKGLKAAAEIDNLTGLANKKRADMLFAREWERARRQKEFLSLVAMDVDSFKAFNVRHGDDVGDEFLLLVSSVLRKCAKRKTDVIARGLTETSLRFGGDEFLVLLPKTDRDGASRVVRSVMEQVKEITLTDGTGKHITPPTISIGLATIIPGGDKELKDLLYEAEESLKQAKDAGGGTFRL